MGCVTVTEGPHIKFKEHLVCKRNPRALQTQFVNFCYFRCTHSLTDAVYNLYSINLLVHTTLIHFCYPCIFSCMFKLLTCYVTTPERLLQHPQFTLLQLYRTLLVSSTLGRNERLEPVEGMGCQTVRQNTTHPQRRVYYDHVETQIPVLTPFQHPAPAPTSFYSHWSVCTKFINQHMKYIWCDCSPSSLKTVHFTIPASSMTWHQLSQWQE